MARAIARGLNFPANCHQFVLKDNQKEQVRIRESANKTLDVQRKINELSGELTNGVSSMGSYSNDIISNAKENMAAIDSLQQTIQNFQTLSNVILEDISQISDINEQYVDNSKVIEDIAFQIKIVSFNASIEAARAGNAGREFGVVAREVGDLANKTQFATQRFESSSSEVSKKTDTIRVNIEDICGAVNQLSETLNGLKSVFEATGNMGYEIVQLSEGVQAITDRIQETINE